MRQEVDLLHPRIDLLITDAARCYEGVKELKRYIFRLPFSPRLSDAARHDGLRHKTAKLPRSAN